MTVIEGDIVDQAIAWHLRLPGASEDDWLRFVDWLEAAPAHSAAYDRVVEDDILSAPIPDPEQEGRLSVVRIEDRSRRLQRRRGWMVAVGGALAASIAGIAYLPHMAAHPDGFGTVVTAPGERREIAMADGSRIEMNGGTELQIADGTAREVSLKHGQAIFHVRHDARRPFEVMVGGVVLRDVGTVFDVTREEGQLGVQVAEGAVMYQPDHEALTLGRGMALAARDGDDQLEVRHVAAESVGGWREGRLTFREAPLKAVAAEIRRTTGEDLVMSGDLAETPFTGSIRLSGDPAKDAAHLAALAGATARRDGTRWILITGSDAP